MCPFLRVRSYLSAVIFFPFPQAIMLQTHFRMFQSRRQAAEERDAELIFVGMRPSPDVDAGKLEKETAAVRIKRKKVQEEKRIAYEKALISLKDVVREEWGPEYREQEMDKRRNWFTTKLQELNFPLEMEQYYIDTAPVVDDGEKKEDEEEGKGKGKGKDDKKDAKKKGKGEEEEVPKEVPPPLSGPSELTAGMGTLLERYDQTRVTPGDEPRTPAALYSCRVCVVLWSVRR